MTLSNEVFMAVCIIALGISTISVGAIVCLLRNLKNVWRKSKNGNY